MSRFVAALAVLTLVLVIALLSARAMIEQPQEIVEITFEPVYAQQPLDCAYSQPLVRTLCDKCVCVPDR